MVTSREKLNASSTRIMDYEGKIGLLDQEL
jgi:hypothetical protein